jgi:hypothetical protein
MPKSPIIIFIFLLLIIGGGLIFLNLQNKKSQPERPSEVLKTNPYFIVEKVYFTETEEPNNVLLNIKLKKNKIAYYKYEIHFPPQEKVPQGIGPIETEFAKPEKFQEEVTTTSEELIQEFITRSYPDNIPEFGKSYFCKIKFYLTNGKKLNWEGNVGWGKETH